MTRIALAQIDTCVGDVDANREAVLGWVARAAEQGADLVAFPEMTLTGYPVEDLALHASFRAAAEGATRRVAADLVDRGLGAITVVLGTIGPPRPAGTHRGDARTAVDEPVAEGAPARVGGGGLDVAGPGGAEHRLPTNRAVVLRDGEVLGTYDKHHLPTYGVFDEHRVFAAGDEPCTVEVAGSRIGLAVCEDVWADGAPYTRGGPVDLLLVLNASPFEEGKAQLRTVLAGRRAQEVGAPVAYVNAVGGQDDLVFDGGSFVVGADGTTATSAPRFVEHLLLWDLPGAAATASTTADAAAPVPGTSAPGALAPELEADAEVYQALVTGLRGYVRKNGFTSVVLGVSGGIDSALVAVIAVDALGPDAVHGISMPSRYSSEHSRTDADELAERTGLHLRTVPIGPMVDAFEAAIPLEGVAAENLQARVRGVVLMAVSNTERRLVLAPGNKSELATGYSTIYGDAVGGYAPIKDVPKTRVWDLARWRNRVAAEAGQVPPIPEQSITKPPSAELAPGQVDQDSLPEYPVLDAVLDGYVGRALGRTELLDAGHDPATVDLVLSLVDRAEWKRRQYPPGPKVTSMAFDRDRRLPITNRWREP